MDQALGKPLRESQSPSLHFNRAAQHLAFLFFLAQMAGIGV